MSDFQVEFDDSEFNRTLREYVLRRAPEKRVKAINTKAYQLAWAAAKLTRVASRQAIEELFGVARRIVKSRKTGKTKAGRVEIGQKTRARAIYVARERKAGRALEGDIDAQARRMVTKRLSGVGSIRAGWIPAIKKLFAVSSVKLGKPDAVLRPGGEVKGYAVRAAKNDLEATIANSMPALEESKARRVAENALKGAFMEVKRDIERYFAQKEMEAAREAGIDTQA